ncbi:MAG: hypothetical protein KTR24_00395 [Saprospiraceae bacterium]|nr:hypothetical protein [Saprospiraceae bacterium]
MRLYHNFTLSLLISTILLLACSNEESPRELPPTESAPAKTFEVRSLKTPLWFRNISFYQVTLGAEPTLRFKDVMPLLPVLKDNGVEAIILSSVFATDDQDRVVDFTKVDPRLGTFEQYRELLQEVRRQRMRVLIEWNHQQVSPSHVWKENNPEWFDQGSDGLDLSHENLQNTLVESMKFWLRSGDVTGFYCTDAKEVPMSFWKLARPSLEAVKPVLMISDADDAVEHHLECFELTAGSNFEAKLDQVLAGNNEVADLIAQYEKEMSTYPATYAKFRNLEPARERGNIQGSSTLKLVIQSIMSGVPLVKSLEVLSQNQSVVKPLMFLRMHNRSLWNASHGGQSSLTSPAPGILRIERTHAGQTVVLIANLSGEKRSYTPTTSERSRSDLYTGKDVSVVAGAEVALNPWQYIVTANPSIQI